MLLIPIITLSPLLLKAIFAFLFLFFVLKCFAYTAHTSSGNLSLQNPPDIFLVWYL